MPILDYSNASFENISISLLYLTLRLLLSHNFFLAITDTTVILTMN